MYSCILLLFVGFIAFAKADYGYDSYVADYGHHPHGKAHHHYSLPAHAIVTKKNPKSAFVYDDSYNKKGHNYGYFVGEEIGYASNAITNNLGHSADDDKYGNSGHQHYTLTGSKGHHNYHKDHLLYPTDKYYSDYNGYY